EQEARRTSRWQRGARERCRQGLGIFCHDTLPTGGCAAGMIDADVINKTIDRGAHTVLVVDDNPSTRYSTERVIRAAGFRTAYAAASSASARSTTRPRAASCCSTSRAASPT